MRRSLSDRSTPYVTRLSDAEGPVPAPKPHRPPDVSPPARNAGRRRQKGLLAEDFQGFEPFEF
ncbi:hypothetical protein GCM10009712_08660 [Pseudarthrobacter sulfonivorans]